MKSVCFCLSLAALFRDEFCIDWIIDISGHKPSHVFSQFENAVLRGWLLKKADGFFAFKDEIIQNEIEGNLSPGDRHRLHKSIAEYFAKEFPENEKFQARIADQLLFGKNDLTGCRLLLAAADHARHNHSYKIASTYYQKIMQDLEGNDTQEGDALFIDAAIKYARISLARENTNSVSSYLEKAILMAKKKSMWDQASILGMHLAKNDYLRGDYRSAISNINQSNEIIENNQDSKYLDSATAFKFYAYFWKGLLKKVVQIYEQDAPTIEKFPSERHRILSLGMVGVCYALTGQLTQGLGMLNALQKHCIELNEQFLTEDIDIAIAGVMLEFQRPEEALSYLKRYEQIQTIDSDWNVFRAYLALAAAYFFIGQEKKAAYYFKKWVDLKNATNVNILLIPYSWFEICKAMEIGTIPQLYEISLEEETSKYIEDENCLLKGIAYRYRAFLQKKQNQHSDKIIETLNHSVESLKKAGYILELCRTYRELINQYTFVGNQNASQELNLLVSKHLMDINRDFIPDELRSFAKESTQDWRSLWDEVLKLSQDMSSIRNPKELLQSILSTSNRITGAERSAIFSIQEQAHDANQPARSYARLKASKNMTSTYLSNAAFAGANKLIEDTVKTGKGKVLKNIRTNSEFSSSSSNILSQICVPMIIRNKPVGVLYLENNLLNSSFTENDLHLLNFFATQAAIALDHAEAYEQVKFLNQKLNEEKQYYKEQSLPELHFDSFIGKSKSILEVLNKINQVANTDTNVLILGETGVGKGLVAQAIHKHSKRKEQPFVTVLCNALPEQLISSELFGHEKGAFTGSTQKRIGRFELADGGTIFLDEIGDLKEEIQTQLLQVIQSKEFERVGSSKTIRSDFRLITATNRNLVEAVQNKKFRADLYYRLNIFPITVPSLRDHKEDIPLLAQHFLNVFSKRTGKEFTGIPAGEMDKLINYAWPGNVRELEGIIERGVILSGKDNFRVPELNRGKYTLQEDPSQKTLEDHERSCIMQALKKTNWKVRGKGGAADLLNINYSTLFFRMKKLNIHRPPDMPRGRKRISLNHP